MAEPMKNANEIRGVLDGCRLQFRAGGKWIDAGGDANTWLVLLVCAGMRDGAYRIKPDGVAVPAKPLSDVECWEQGKPDSIDRSMKENAMNDTELALKLASRFGVCVGKDMHGRAYVGYPGTKDVILFYEEGNDPAAEQLKAVVRAVASGVAPCDGGKA